MAADTAVAPTTPPAAAGPAVDKSTPAVFLIHGLGGTQYDLGSMHKRLKNAGFVTHSLTLPGHGTTPEDLVHVTAEQWMEAVTAKYHEVAAQHDNFHIMGMCMGALLATELAKRQKHTRGKLIALAPPIYIDGWATAWYTPARHLMYYLPGVPARMKVEEEDPFGIKNEQLRAIVKAKFARGENFHYRWVPLACVRQVDRLRRWVMTDLKSMASETLVIHAREDELTSLASANYLVEQIGGAKARMVVLENSYHMICVDNDREQVARNVLEFFGASSAASLGMAVDDPKMSTEALQAFAQSLRAALEAGDFSGIFAKGASDMAWFQPGANRASGIYRGNKGLQAMLPWSGGVKFTAFGQPVFNAGIAVLPATLTAAGLMSQGVLAFAVRSGRLLDARWFPDDLALEDAHFGAPVAPAGPSEAERAFEAAGIAVKTLAKPPGNDELLALYAFYKQATVGDATGDRPGMMDVTGRAKYDAWVERKGMAREAAMTGYAELVEKLKTGG
ncbi:acyl-CoA-binding protein [Polaromonas sp. LjRoot131]|uniref:acyl-CoA-binding protein n=1 Tax=Polaromonas sp. LjRoot131 TaxID=3342262 RepID=UPI003ED02F66